MSSESQFKLVVNKKRRNKLSKNKLNQLLSSLSTLSYADDKIDEEKLFKIMIKIIEEMKKDDYLLQLKKSLLKLNFNQKLKNLIKNNLKVCQVICYGLGSFSQESVSQYQLAFLIALKETQIISSSKWLIFDPIFTLQEKNILKRFNLQLIESNDKCKKSINEPTFCFMPHCHKILFNNILWANWSKDCINNLIILGNSFNSMIDCLNLKVARKEYNYLFNSIELNLVQEHQLMNCFKFKDVFSDINLHTFYTDNEQLLTRSWSSQEPIYSDIDNLESLV